MLANIPTEVGSLIVLEGRPCTGETDEAIVAAAWDFSEITSRYAAYDQVLAARPQGRLETLAAAAEFQHWLGQERQAWQAAIEHDPFLPEALLPNGYAGQAWRDRLEAMAAATEQMVSFQGC